MKLEKLQYEKASLEVLLLHAPDIVTASNPTGDIVEGGDDTWA